MYERFTDRARKAIELTWQEARRFNHEYVGTEHLLLGLLKVRGGVAVKVLRNLDVDSRTIRLDVEKLMRSGRDPVTSNKIPQTPQSKKVIEHSLEEARNMRHSYIGSEHILLGLLGEKEGIAFHVLENRGLNIDRVREEVLNTLGLGIDETLPADSIAAPADESFLHHLSRFVKDLLGLRL